MSKKAYTNNNAISTPKVLPGGEHKGQLLIKLVDYKTLFVTVALRAKLLNMIKNKNIPLLASPCMSDETIASNKCAEIIEVSEKKDGIYARIIPKGNKERVVKHMFVDGGASICARLVGTITKEDPYLLKTVSYIRLYSSV